MRCQSCVAGRVKQPAASPDEESGEAVPFENTQEEQVAGIELRPAAGPVPGQLCPYTFFFASSENGDMSKWPRLVVRYQ